LFNVQAPQVPRVRACNMEEKGGGEKVGVVSAEGDATVATRGGVQGKGEAGLILAKKTTG